MAATALAVGVLVVIGVAAAIGRFDFRFGPGKGQSSLHLPVALHPATGLRPGQTVRVTSSAFSRDTRVGVAVCLQEADTKRRGVDACDTVQGSRYYPTRAGGLDATYAVPRIITVGSRAYDCARRPRRCLLVAADSSNYDDSGGQALTFRAGLPPAPLVPRTVRPQSNHLPVTVRPSPELPVRVGQQIIVDAKGFQPDEALMTGWCSLYVEVEGTNACDPTIGGGVSSTVHADSSGHVHLTAQVPGAIQPLFSQRTSGEVSCHGPRQCMFAVGASADSQRSALVPLTVRP